MARRPLIAPGERYGRLTAVRPAPGRFWEFVCECGTQKIIRYDAVRRGGTLSCGCLRRERDRCLSMSSLRSQHGHARRATGMTPIYRSWHSMRQRCLNSRCQTYPRYGGRGISICQRWLDSFDNFLADMKERPPGTCLDRIDNDGNYSPENCRWATMKEQSNNHSRNVLLTYRGETRNVTEWSNALGFRPSTLRNRLRNGWPAEYALSRPVSAGRARHKSTLPAA